MIEPIGPAAKVIERRDQEGRGRWEDRCDFAWDLAYDRRLICDRLSGHRGMHTGRLFSGTKVIGYVRLRHEGAK